MLPGLQCQVGLGPGLDAFLSLRKRDEKRDDAFGKLVLSHKGSADDLAIAEVAIFGDLTRRHRDPCPAIRTGIDRRSSVALAFLDESLLLLLPLGHFPDGVLNAGFRAAVPTMVVLPDDVEFCRRATGETVYG